MGLSKIVGVRHQTVCYHLKRLRRRGHVVAHPKGNRLLHFLNGAVAPEAEHELILVARDPTTMRLLEKVESSPGIMKKGVASESGLTQTGAAWHVNKLVRFGLVREVRSRGQCHLYAVPDKIDALRRFASRSSHDPASLEPDPLVNV